MKKPATTLAAAVGLAFAPLLAAPVAHAYCLPYVGCIDPVVPGHGVGAPGNPSVPGLPGIQAPAVAAPPAGIASVPGLPGIAAPAPVAPPVVPAAAPPVAPPVAPPAVVPAAAPPVAPPIAEPPVIPAAAPPVAPPAVPAVAPVAPPGSVPTPVQEELQTLENQQAAQGGPAGPNGVVPGNDPAAAIQALTQEQQAQEHQLGLPTPPPASTPEQDLQAVENETRALDNRPPVSSPAAPAPAAPETPQQINNDLQQRLFDNPPAPASPAAPNAAAPLGAATIPAGLPAGSCQIGHGDCSLAQSDGAGYTQAPGQLGQDGWLIPNNAPSAPANTEIPANLTPVSPSGGDGTIAGTGGRPMGSVEDGVIQDPNLPAGSCGYSPALAYGTEICNGVPVGTTPEAAQGLVPAPAAQPQIANAAPTPWDPTMGGIVDPTAGGTLPQPLPPDNGMVDTVTNSPCNLAQDPQCEPGPGVQGTGHWVGSNDQCISGRDGDNCISNTVVPQPNDGIVAPLPPPGDNTAAPPPGATPLGDQSSTSDAPPQAEGQSPTDQSATDQSTNDDQGAICTQGVIAGQPNRVVLVHVVQAGCMNDSLINGASSSGPRSSWDPTAPRKPSQSVLTPGKPAPTSPGSTNNQDSFDYDAAQQPGSRLGPVTPSQYGPLGG